MSAWMTWNDDFTMAVFPAAMFVDIAFYALYYGASPGAVLRNARVRASYDDHDDDYDYDFHEGRRRLELM